MAKLQYTSFDEINADPATLLKFATTLKAEFSAMPASTEFRTFAHHEVHMKGKPLSMTAQMVNLESRDQDMDEMKPEDMMALHKAGTILRQLEPTWDISSYQSDPRVANKLEEMKQLAPVDGLASRMGSTLAAKPAEHTVRTMLRM